MTQPPDALARVEALLVEPNGLRGEVNADFRALCTELRSLRAAVPADAALSEEMIALIRTLAQQREPKLHSLADALERWATRHHHHFQNTEADEKVSGLSETCFLCGAKQGWLE